MRHLKTMARFVRGSLVAASTICAVMGIGASSSFASSPMTRALYVHSAGSPTDVATIQSGLVGTGMIGTVDELDVQNYTPVAADIDGYDYVFVASNQDMQDNHVVGNLLADYVDAGGRVVEMTFSFACSHDGTADVKWGLGGRWEDELYSPILPDPNTCAGYRYDDHFTLVAEAGQSSSPYLAGVGNLAMDTSLSQNFTNINTNLFVASGATSIARWNDGDETPLLAVGDNCVIGINVWPQDIQYRVIPSEGYRLMANAAVTSCVVTRSTTTTSTTTTSTTATSTTSTTSTTSSVGSTTTLVATSTSTGGMSASATTTSTVSPSLSDGQASSSGSAAINLRAAAVSRVEGPIPATGGGVGGVLRIAALILGLGLGLAMLRRRFATTL